MGWQRRVPFFYGWVIVAVAFICLGLGYSTWLSFSIFYVAILEDFGWSRAATAATFSLFTIANGFAAVAAGGLIDRFGSRAVVPTAALVVGGGLLLTTRVSEIWQYYLSFGIVVAVGLSGIGMVPNLTMVSNWFLRKRGAAAGLATSGLGVGVLVLIPLLQAIITDRGWRSAYVVLALAIALLVPALSLLFHRHRPQELGLLPDGEQPRPPATPGPTARPPDGSLVVDRKWASREWTPRMAVRTRRFWFVFLGRFVELVVMNLFIAHQMAFLVDAGYDRLLAASALGLFGIVGSGAQILWGLVSDRIGRERAFSLAFAVGTMAAGIVLSLGPGSPAWLPYIYGTVAGAYWASSSVLWPALTADIFHGKRFGSIFGVLYIGGGCGAALGAFLGGYIFDVAGSYDPAFLLAIPTMWLCCLLYWLAAPRHVRRVLLEGARERDGARKED